MVAVRFSIPVDEALLEILGHISRDNPAAALDLVEDLQRRIVETLSQFPDSGATFRNGRRFLTIRRYTFVYRHYPEKDEVWVMEVFGPGMDWR